jgi:hypothetical protein
VDLTLSHLCALERTARRASKRNNTTFVGERDGAIRRLGRPSHEAAKREATARSAQVEMPSPVASMWLRFGDAATSALPRSLRVVLSGGARSVQFPALGFLVYRVDRNRDLVLADVRVEVIEGADLGRDAALAQVRAAAEGSGELQIGPDFPLVTQFVYGSHYQRLCSMLDPWSVEHILARAGDLTYAQATGSRPAWYKTSAHAQLFCEDSQYRLGDADDLEAGGLFYTPWYRRARAAGELVHRLAHIEGGPNGATAFQHWVADVLAVLFPLGLRSIECNPNGKADVRRDIVATNARGGVFWNRVGQDYGAREVVFEVKNFLRPKNRDFYQVLAYLGAPQHGTVGFLVTRSAAVEVAAETWERARTIRPTDGTNKLVLVLPSALLVEMLRMVCVGRQHGIDEAMDRWLSTILRRHFA